jgi:hypothetical protein
LSSDAPKSGDHILSNKHSHVGCDIANVVTQDLHYPIFFSYKIFKIHALSFIVNLCFLALKSNYGAPLVALELSMENIIWAPVAEALVEVIY